MTQKVKTHVNINGIFERYNQAFGYTAMKIAPRLIQMGFISPKWFLNIPTYNKADSTFAEMIFQNSITGSIYSFGIDDLDNGTPALPFVTKKPNVRRFLAPPPMVSFSRGKNVVRTSIDRSNAEVIENFGNKAYEIKLQGILIDAEEHAYPGDLLKEVHNLFEENGTFKVTGDIFHDLNITELFFDSGLEIGFVEGYVDTVKFSVNAIAIEPAEFLIQ